MGKRLIQVLGAEALQSAAPLFANWPETMIWSALEGGMGRIWTVAQPPRAALCENADFLFLAGSADEPQTAEVLEAWREERKGQFVILTPRDPACAALIENLFRDTAVREERYAFCKDGETFDREQLERFAGSLDPAFEMKPFDEALYHKAMENEWSRDFCSQFEHAQDFLARGIGVAVLKDGVLVGGASSYAVYSGGIEIQIQTREDCQRRGIALACGARLILTCLERGLYPSWDAANIPSARLARKLGYVDSGIYPVWELQAYKGDETLCSGR